MEDLFNFIIGSAVVISIPVLLVIRLFQLYKRITTLNTDSIEALSNVPAFIRKAQYLDKDILSYEKKISDSTISIDEFYQWLLNEGFIKNK